MSDLVCSLDKIKIKVAFKVKCIDLVGFFDSDFSSLFPRFKIIDKYESKNIMRYRYAYKIQPLCDSEGVVFISFCYNGGFSGKYSSYYSIVEYNPSKLGAEFVSTLFLKFRFDVVSIISFDVAFDIPGVDVSSVGVFNRNETVMSYGTSSNLTHYVSPKTRDGRVKVYQKDVERKQKVDKVIDKTLRIECTFCLPDILSGIVNDSLLGKLDFYVKRLNYIKWFNACYGDDYVLILLAYASEDVRKRAFSCMSVNTKQKYKKFLKHCFVGLDLDSFGLSVVIMDLLKDFVKGGHYCYGDCVFGL